MKGQFDDEGLMEGSWLVTYTKNGIPIEQKYMYLKGILFTIITKDVSTGETSSNFDLEPRVKDFLKNLDVNNNTSFTRNQYYTLETLKPNRNGDLIDQALSIWIDNKSIENSAYNFEVKQGTIDIDNFPQKIMAENRERNEQKEKDDQERKEALEMKSGSQITGLRSGITVTKGVRPLNLGALKFEDDFSENAKIYLVVKFNANGIYESSDTANGTTTFNATTIDIAKRKAAEFKFPLTANGGFSTILFNFKMQ